MIIVHDRMKVEVGWGSGVYEDADVFLAKCEVHGVVGKWRKTMGYAKRDWRKHYKDAHETQLSLL